MKKLKLALMGVTLGGMALLAGCGAGPGPDLSGPNGATYLAAYSGDWEILRLESDNLGGELREASEGRAPSGGFGGRAGGRGGRGGGMSGGGRGGGGMPGGMAGGRGGMDPEQMQARMEAVMALARTPTEVSLTLTADRIRVGQEGVPPLSLELGAEEAEFAVGDVPFYAAAEWTDEGLVIQRGLDSGGAVTDKMKVDEKGRLVVERRIDTPMRGGVKGTLVYRKR